MIVGIKSSITSSWQISDRGRHINVSLFGAKGDGVTDDQPAIQRAIEHCSLRGYKTLNLNTGVYYLSSVATGVGSSIPTSEIGYGAGEFLNIGYYPDPLSTIRYSNMYDTLSYVPVSTRKINLNIIGTGGTVLSAVNIRSKIYGGHAAMFALRENISNFKLRGVKLLWDGDLCGTGFQSHGIIIASNYGGATYGRNVYWPIDRESIEIIGCDFVNCNRAITSASTILSGRGTETVTISGCNFLYPKGSDSSATNGGGQVMLFGPDTLNLNIIDNFAEGTSDVPVKSPNGLAKDGFLFYGGVNTKISGNTMTRFAIETLVPSTGCPSLGILGGNTMPRVGETISLTANEISRSPGGGNYTSFNHLTAFMGFSIGSIVSTSYSSSLNAHFGVYRIDGYIEKAALKMFEVLVTRLSGEEYGGDYMNFRSAPAGAFRGHYSFLYPFNYQNKIGANSIIINNDFVGSLSFSANDSPAQYAHNPAILSETGYTYISGNNIAAKWAGYAAGSGGSDYKCEWMMERNNIFIGKYSYPVGTSNLESNSYRFTAKNNKFYFWSDLENNRLWFDSPTLGNNSYKYVGSNLNWGHNSVSNLSISSNSTPKSIFIDNEFICTYSPLSSTLVFVNGQSSVYDTVSGNTLVNLSSQ